MFTASSPTLQPKYASWVYEVYKRNEEPEILRELRNKLFCLVFGGLHLFVAKIKVFNGRGEVLGTGVMERKDGGGDE
ncbi:hypothetical protein RIF29_19354 [Crotalaria pallida]|uniref:Uncharacterized protein n=1 Tax=Crotalaria pallida TaxID=3830 RepID=A0AAN9F7N4_CROPI